MIDTPKEAAIKAFKETKDDASYDELMYKLYVMAKINRGVQDFDENKYLSNKDAKRRLDKWLK